jgi:hypothetical protein
MSDLDVWYSRLDVNGIIRRWGAGVDPKQVKELRRNVAKAAEKDQIKARTKLTRADGDRVCFVSDPPLLVPVIELYGTADAAALEGFHDYYVRQLWDWKLSADIDTMEPDARAIYGPLSGWTLARAHARSGDPVAIGSYLGARTFSPQPWPDLPPPTPTRTITTIAVWSP